MVYRKFINYCHLLSHEIVSSEIVIFEYMDVYTTVEIHLAIWKDNYVSSFMTWNTIILAFCKQLSIHSLFYVQWMLHIGIRINVFILFYEVPIRYMYTNT
jgi:hypothetical protein